MAIKQLINTRQPGELRRFQARMTTLGKIRTGIFAQPEGKRGRPAKLDSFRFTSPDRDLITAVAAEYGGEVTEFKPQGAGTPGWEVVTDADRIPVYIVNGQKIDPTYEAWAAGRRCIRRCDGEWNSIEQAPCVCNGLNPDQEPPAPKDMCKPTTRVSLMLQAVEGFGSWLYESHGENFALEVGGVLAQFVAAAPVPVPAWFCLEQEKRQSPKPGGGFEPREFYVARFRITAVTPEQIAIGGDTVTRALAAAGAPLSLAGDRRAIEAAQASAPLAPRPPESAAPVADLKPGEPDPNGGVRLTREEYQRLLTVIEEASSLPRLDGIKAKMKERDVRYVRLREAWTSKYNAIQAEEGLADTLRPEEERVPHTPAPEVDEHFAPEGGSAFAEAMADEMAATHAANPVAHLAQELGAEPVEGALEGDGDGLPMVPDGDYEIADEWAKVMRLAGQRTEGGKPAPWKLDEVRAAVCTAFGLGHVGEATGLQLARFAAALKQGML